MTQISLNLTQCPGCRTWQKTGRGRRRSPLVWACPKCGMLNGVLPEADVPNILPPHQSGAVIVDALAPHAPADVWLSMADIMTLVRGRMGQDISNNAIRLALHSSPSWEEMTTDAGILYRAVPQARTKPDETSSDTESENR